MKRLLVLSLLAILMLPSVSCIEDMRVNPNKIFSKIGLNGNKIPRNFSSHFTEMRAHKARGSLVIITEDQEIIENVSVLEYIENRYVNMFERDIEGIKELRTDEESQPIIDAGLDMFEYAQEIYRNDFPKIAKMIDEGRPDSEIDAAIEELEITKGVELDIKYDITMDLLLPYADKKGVKYSIQHTKY